MLEPSQESGPVPPRVQETPVEPHPDRPDPIPSGPPISVYQGDPVGPAAISCLRPPHAPVPGGIPSRAGEPCRTTWIVWSAITGASIHGDSLSTRTRLVQCWTGGHP